MKVLGALVLAAALLAPGITVAGTDYCQFEDGTVRARNGEIIGNIYTSGGGTTTFRDASGSIVGSSTTSDTGRTTYRDDDGSIVGTRDVTPAGNVVYRDDSGSIIDEAPPPFRRFCREH